MIRLLFSGSVALIGGIFLLGIVLPVNAQRLDEIGKGPLLNLQGSVSVHQMAYFASGIARRRDPYNFLINAGLNLDFYGWVVPLTFTYSNQSKGAFQQPFNQFALNPSYKWVSAHIGTQSMTLSGYTMNGHMFSGLGVEITPPGRWQFNILAGRFQKAVPYQQQLTHSLEPAYQRYGYGVKVSYNAKIQYDLIVFKAKDQVESLGSAPLFPGLYPQDNLAIGLNFKKKVAKNLLVRGEVAVSALTGNARMADSIGGISGFAGFLKTNSSTSFRRAVKSGIDYSAGRVVVGIGYERVDPEYKTLGAYYFNNDLQNITGSLSTRLFEEKLNVALNAGFQNNDLKRDRQSRMKRFVGSLNLGLNLSSALSFSGGYSSFQSYTNVRSNFQQINQLTPYDNLDTLNYRQISDNATLGATYIISKDQRKTSAFTINLTYFKTSDVQGGSELVSGGGFYNLNSSFSLNLVPQKVSFLLGANVNKNSSGDFTSLTYGPSAGVTGSFLKNKLRNNLAVAWNRSSANGAVNSSVLNARFGASHTYRKKHAINVGFVFLDRQMPGQTLPLHMNEYTATVGYQYSL